MRDRRARLALLTVAAAAAVAVFWLATDLFPHHSSNHDEGVYLQQAELLLDGQLWFRTPVPDAVHPWFFVEDGTRLYPKYTPVPAAVFALGVAVGVPRLSLALVAALNVALAGLLGAEATDDRTGVLAGALVGAAPLFLLDSAVFLPYAPTTLCNLAFALGYVRACRADTRRGRRGYAALAGTAVAAAFFARPYTAVLFAAPFVAHAGLVSLRTLRRRDGEAPLGLDRAVLDRYLLVGVLGASGVLVSLLYNWVVTGDPLLFPYQAFAPEDGPGFGVRRILGYEREYTPALALRANARVLWRLFTQWAVAGPLGTLAAAVGLVVAGGRAYRDSAVSLPAVDGLSDHGVRALLAWLFVSVPVGNLFFWGNLNILAVLSVPDDGLISLIGPFYHFDLLVPLGVFGALGLVAGGRRLRTAATRRWSGRTATVLSVVAFAALLSTAAVAQAAALDGPVGRNERYTDRYERAYEPFEEQSVENALVFVPTPYGEWLNHPFQSLRNGPGFDGPVVYALDRDPAEDFRVLRTFEARQPYRYTYRGQWVPAVETVRQPVRARLQPLRVARGERHRVTVETGRVAGAETATVRLAGPDGATQYGTTDIADRTQTVDWTVGEGRAWVDESGLVRYSDQRFIRFDGAAELALTVTYTQAGGSTVTYRQELTVNRTADGVAVVWPPRASVCDLVSDCGHEGTYLDGVGGYGAGVSLNQSLTTGGSQSP